MDYVGEVVCLSLDSIIFGIFLKEYLRNRHALQSVQKAPEFHTEKKLNFFLDENGGYYPYIAIRGFVKALSPAIRSIHNPHISGVIQKHSIKEHVVSRSSSGFWTESQRTINEVFNSIPFAVVTKKGSLEIEVIDPFAAKILDLEVISDKFDPSNSGFMDHMWGFFTGVRKRGLQTIEEILKEGTLVTAVGEIQSDTGSLRIQPPSDGTSYFLTTMPLNALIRRLDEKVNYYWFVSIQFTYIY
ncbi:UNVERIFIED_CONTAM: hypothetical protein PYX00_005161 [Menopon gallinae]|uniref:RING-type E3 ubiquitin transferase n=1 Tax=Menopon gallinae TaxID=328185 RepID=A0AAW2HQ98_9NEOP